MVSDPVNASTSGASATADGGNRAAEVLVVVAAGSVVPAPMLQVDRADVRQRQQELTVGRAECVWLDPADPHHAEQGSGGP